MDERVIRLLEQITSRHFGKYRGIVTDNADPRQMGRVRAMVPELLGAEKTGWALPCAPYAGEGAGLFAVPEKGAGVWIEFEAGDLSRPIWSGTWWSPGQAPADGNPTRKVIRTAAGHAITLDDQAGTVVITDKDGATITMEPGNVEITKGSTRIAMDGRKVSINDGALEVT